MNMLSYDFANELPLKLIENMQKMRESCCARGFGGGTMGKWQQLQAQLVPFFSTCVGVLIVHYIQANFFCLDPEIVLSRLSGYFNYYFN